MTRAGEIGTVYANQIAGAIASFGDHEGMSEPRIIRWMVQFSDGDLPLAVKILDEIRYFNDTNVRSMVRGVLGVTEGELKGYDPQRIVYVPLEKQPGGGAATVARVLRHLTDPYKPRVLTMVDLANTDPTSVDAIVCVDDFVGTGDTFLTWWDDVAPLILPLGALLVVAPLVMTAPAVARVSEIALASPVRQLEPATNVLGQESPFDDGEKERLRHYCESTGCPETYLHGYGDSGLLLAFSHQCPNNSLPILWYGKKDWSPLFVRRAI